MKRLLQNYQTSCKMMKQSPMFRFLVVFTRNKLLNHKDVVSKIVVNDLETFRTGLRDCSCKESPFVDINHGQIINNHLRKLMRKGTIFPETRTINWYIYKYVTTRRIENCS